MEYTHKAHKTECKINNSMHFASERNQAIISDLISFWGGKRTIGKYKIAMIFCISICISISTYMFEINRFNKQMSIW